MQFCCIGSRVMERNREEPKGFQHMGRKIKEPWQGSGDLSFLPSCTCSSYMHTFLHCCVRAASHSDLLSSYVSLSFGSWNTGSHRSRREGRKAGLGERWKILWMQQVPLETNWVGGGLFNGKCPSQTLRASSCRPYRSMSIPSATPAW